MQKQNLRRTHRPAPAIAIAIAMAALLAAAVAVQAQEPVQVASPDGRNVVTVGTRDGSLFYTVERDGRKIVLPSPLGFEFRDAPPLGDGLELSGTERSTVDETWEQPWGEVARVRDHHNELRVSVAEMEEPGRRFDVVFRVFDDGLGKALEQWQRRAGLGQSPRPILEELRRIQSTDVVLPTTDGRELRLRCVVRPDTAQGALLDRLGLELPQRLRLTPPVATAARM